MAGIVVVGGGWAGLAAARTLCDEGFEVTVLERRGVLGGRAAALEDRTSGSDVGSGAHVLLAGWSEARSLWNAASLSDRLVPADPPLVGDEARKRLARAAGGRGDEAVLLPRGGLRDVVEGIREHLVRTGGRVLTRSRAQILSARDGRVDSVAYAERPQGRDAIRRGEDDRERRVAAEGVVLAVPPTMIASLVGAAGSVPAVLGSLPHRYSVTLELWLEKPTTSSLVTLLPGDDFDWALDRGRLDADLAQPSRHLTLHAMVPAGTRRTNAEWVRRGVDALARAIEAPVAVARCLVLREPMAVPATSCDVAGVETQIGLRGLALAGDWADPEAPGTLEGAVRSGRRAAARLASRAMAGARQ